MNMDKIFAHMYAWMHVRVSRPVNGSNLMTTICNFKQALFVRTGGVTFVYPLMTLKKDEIIIQKPNTVTYLFTASLDRPI